jgi:hypothetical protein
MRDNIVLSDAPHALDTYAALGEGDVILFGGQMPVESLKRGQRYRVEIVVTASQTLNDAELLGVEPLQ